MASVDSITVPETLEELDEFLNDTPKVMNALKAGKLKEIIISAVNIHTHKDADLVAQFKEQMQLELADFVKQQDAKGAARDGER